MNSSALSSPVRHARVLLLAGCSGLALAATAGVPAVAQTSISASSVWTVGIIPGVESQSTPTYPSPNIEPSASDLTGDSIFGHVYGDPTGGNYFGSRSSGQGSFNITGTLNYQSTYVNTTGGVIDPTLAFVIDAGDLNVSLPTGATSASATLQAIITESINGGPATDLFDYESTMTATSSSSDPGFTETGATFNPAGPTLSPGEGDYNWSAYSGDASIGTLNPGDTVVLDYQLISNATGDGTCSSGGGVLAEIGYGGNGTSCDTAVARIGDPNTITADVPFVVSTPEPASAAVLGAGLASLAFMRRRRRAD
jgi:hypothetical protein